MTNEVTSTNRQEENDNYYNNIYAKPYDTKRFSSVYQVVCHKIMQMPIPHILECGCGTGILGQQLSGICHTKLESSYFGFDFSQTAIDKCPLSIKSTIMKSSAYNQSIWTMSLYNVVVAVEVFEHLNDLKVIKMIPRKTRIIFSVPDFDSRSHLRTYPSSGAILKYYKDLLNITFISRLTSHDTDKTIFICDSFRK